MNASAQGESMPLSDARTSALLKRLIRSYVGPYKRRISLAVVCMVVAAAMTAANAWLMQPMLDEVFVEKNITALQLIPLAIIAIAVLNGLASFGETILMRYVGQRVIADMQLDLFGHVIRADLDMLHSHSAGRLISRFTNDIQMLRHSISNVLTGVAKECLSMIFLIGVMFYQSWELTLMALIGFPLAIFPIARLGRRMRKLSDGTQHELGELTAQLDESFQGVRIVKAYGTEAFEEERARTRVERLFGLYFKAARIQAAASPMMEMIGGIAIAIVVWYGGYQVVDGRTTPGAFFSFITAMLMAYKPVKSIASLNTHLQEGLAAARRFFSMLDTESRVQDAPHATALQLSEARVELDNISFAYGESGAGVHGISLTLEPGQVAALVGPSGGGKSTLINLILRFYDVTGGTIRIDGQDIREVTQASLREHIALVSQDVVLFDDTVAANIAYGRPDLSREAVMEAAKQADAHDFIMGMAQGYDTMIGPHGVRLSGGQRQRLSIARAILRDAPILLLDEATSALDTQSERSVQQALNQLMQGRTTLVIAHRLSTIQHADVIYVLDQGKVVEHGTHDELVHWNGAYAGLHAMQFAGGAAQ
tara:strand:- start:9 stop:1796 length:1788 start_codon:yes stop_codon:yes gene_type:complete